MLDTHCLHGLDLATVSRGDEAQYTTIARNHPVWPMEGSVFLVDDTIVVNIGVDHLAVTEQADGFRQYDQYAPAGYEVTWIVYNNNNKIAQFTTQDENIMSFKFDAPGDYCVRTRFYLGDTKIENNEYTTVGGDASGVVTMLDAEGAILYQE